MKMFKRIAAVVLAGVMAVGMMTACSTSVADKLEAAAVKGVAAGLGAEEKNDADLASKVYTNLGSIDNDGRINTATVSFPVEGAKEYADWVEAVNKGEEDAKACSFTMFYFLVDTTKSTDEAVYAKAFGENDTAAVTATAEQSAKNFKAKADAFVKQYKLNAEDVTFSYAVVSRKVGDNVYMGYAVKINLPTVKAPKAE